MSEHSTAETAGHPEMDNALAQARTWRQDVHNLQLLTVYAHRIQRACEKNTAELKAIQAERKEIAKESMRQAKLLYQLAEAEGKPYRPEAYFLTAPEVRESVFSAPEIAHEISRDTLFQDARSYDFDGSLPKKVEPKHPVEARATVGQASRPPAEPRP